MEEQRDFKGVWIPKEVWLDKRLSALEKVVLAEINSLDNENGCWASNQYLADFCQCSDRHISRVITHLKELGYIEMSSFDGRNRTLRSRMDKMSGAHGQNGEATTTKCPPTNINSNLPNNNGGKTPRHSAKRFVPPTVEEVETYCNERRSGIDAQSFCDFYESKGWMVGKNKMKDWKAAVRTWERNNYGGNGGGRDVHTWNGGVKDDVPDLRDMF